MPKKKTKRIGECQDLAIYGKAPLMVLRNRNSSKLYLQQVDVYNFNYQPECDIVATLECSDFGPYIAFMEKAQQTEINNKLFALIANVSSIGLKSQADRNTNLPQKLREVYLKAIKSFRCYFYDAEHFFKKIRKLVAMLWKRTQTYKDFEFSQNSKQLISHYAN